MGGEGEEAITFASCVAHVLARAPARFTLCGYSLGGRVALHVALAAPERVARLVLVSTTAGIEDASERAERSVSDHRLADELEPGVRRFDSFIERWRTQPLFAGDPPEVGALARDDQRRNRPDALAAVLRGLGTGEMQPQWERLADLRCPSPWSLAIATPSSWPWAGGWLTCSRMVSWWLLPAVTGFRWRTPGTGKSAEP